MSLGSLAEQLDLPKSATDRLLQTLMTRGYVAQDAASQDYSLSLKVALLGFRYLDARRLPDVAQDALDRLAHDCGEYCRISVVQGEELVWIARAQGAKLGLRYDPPMGGDVVLHATATGKAWAGHAARARCTAHRLRAWLCDPGRLWQARVAQRRRIAPPP